MTRVRQLRKVATEKAGDDFWLNDNLACIVTYANGGGDPRTQGFIGMLEAREIVEARAKTDGITPLEASELVKREKRKAYIERRAIGE